MKKILVLFSALFVWGQTAQAGGFMVGEMATRSAGMGSAFTAVADDASAAWHNPAGVAFTTGKQLMVGGDVILTSNKHLSNSGVITNGKDGTFVVPHAYFTYWDENSSLGASLSINSPFGLETSWPDTVTFSNKNTFSRINMVMVNPSVIFKISDNFSIAAGLDYAYLNKVDLNNTVQLLSGKGDGWGGNASIFYKGEAFNFGVTYRSKIKVNIDGTATAVAGGPLAAFPFGATSTAATTAVTLPDQVNVGLAFMPNDQLTLSVDVDWVNWKTYKSIDIAYGSAAYRGAVGGLTAAAGGGGLGAIFAAIGAQSGSTSLPQNWKATVAVRVGAEWAYNSQMRARVGYIYDPSPINDVDFSPAVPGNDRHIASIGYGYDVTPDATVDLGYAYVYIKARNQKLSPATPVGAPNSVKNGIYKGDAHILMASLNYHF
ncbi:long-chain fatty acid transport protein [Mariprofundus micogutta]|uniref:Long-chain fatty acid transport protein n=1 Tax=Mariprofundus micogutta TaxID=1921010 RepID=A0A1L8CKE2_9PROT|nr:outer membrane protein transport protein [Mariprofundus micogutta]GAV19371.1 long-chain fatty acid transport protein [Mariprofundus micogutta]